ncbi:MAG TPA: methylmalonyl Co-A mutase-associated GTPase MeaB [Cyclobacteriaceae bacterium]|nr:methylmalonyl Co-A mutase-associated GTPase MeaB [Cyclobacteriaceae bacterium]
MLKSRLSLAEYQSGIRNGDTFVLAQAITLVESTLPQDRQLADQLLTTILPFTGNSIRLGITGIPGVGKSTFIEAFGKYITKLNKKLAVLTVDPSSQLTKGSILGDKTRMEELSRNNLAFIRPSSSGSAMGGVTLTTREAILLCEASGYEVIVVETVGVGQSEVAIKNMVDFFLLLMLPGAGDELQGLKKGIIEMADALVITKADGENIKKAREAQAEYQHALHLLPSSSNGSRINVLTCSAVANEGIDSIWSMINSHIITIKESGFFHQNREQQNIHWFHDCFNNLLSQDISLLDRLAKSKRTLEDRVRRKEIPVRTAAREMLDIYHEVLRGSKS